MNGRPQTKERGLLDASVVIASDADYVPGVLAISAATLAELHFGVLVASSAQVRAERLRRMSLLQRRFDALPLDEAAAASYGRLAAAAVVVEAGRQPRRRTMDLLIAATAHAHYAVLYTRNPDDFAGLEGLIDVRVV